MWDISKSVIQLEVSSKIAKYYSTFPGLNAKKLLYEIDELRNTFAKMDVVLPSINISIADSLPPDSYILHIGVYHFMRDFKTDKIIEILHAFVSQYTYDNYCKESVTELFNKGVSQLHANNFQEAYSSFANTYYCSSIYKENYDVMVNSILNLCGIEFINQNFDSALALGKRACFLSANESFYNPWLKYYSEYSTATILVQKGMLQEALEGYSRAYNYLTCLNVVSDVDYLLLTLLSIMVQINIQLNQYYESAELIKRIFCLLQKNNQLCIEKEEIITLALIQAEFYDSAIDKIKSEYMELQNKYTKLYNSLLYGLAELAINVLIKYRNISIPLGFGSLLFDCPTQPGRQINVLQLAYKGNNIATEGDIYLKGD